MIISDEPSKMYLVSLAYSAVNDKYWHFYHVTNPSKTVNIRFEYICIMI